MIIERNINIIKNKRNTLQGLGMMVTGTLPVFYVSIQIGNNRCSEFVSMPTRQKLASRPVSIIVIHLNPVYYIK